MQQQQTNSVSTKKLAVFAIAGLGVAAIAITIAAVIAYNSGKKKAPVCPTCPKPDGSRVYNFYPGVDLMSGTTTTARMTPVPAVDDFKLFCDDMEGCIAFNANGYHAEVILPFSQWDANSQRFATGTGSYLAAEADPQKDAALVYFPGVTLQGVMEPVETAPAGTTLNDMTAYASSKGYAGFSKTGLYYDTLVTKNHWIPNKVGLYVFREFIPDDTDVMA